MSRVKRRIWRIIKSSLLGNRLTPFFYRIRIFVYLF